jgi:hexosaminidase
MEGAMLSVLSYVGTSNGNKLCCARELRKQASLLSHSTHLHYLCRETFYSIRMKKKIASLLMATCGWTALAAQSLPLIPYPSSLIRGEGDFVFNKVVTVAADDYPGDSIRHILTDFTERLTATTGITARSAKAKRAQLYLQRDTTLAAEGYHLDVTAQRIIVAAARPAGFFYALQTLQQLLPSRTVLAGKRDSSVAVWTLPVACITDAPRFAWRGFMLDEGRHFFGKEEIKRVLDIMAVYKMNRFHWHLTEDQGWRIEIKKYPRLTDVGAWRDSKVLGWGDVTPDGQRYGGYYTQEDVREIVDYARQRFIEIVPEVDIPGHSQAAVAAYPEMLACDPEQPHEVWLWQGVSSDVINVASPEAVRFACDVIDELSEIFPFPYLHLGGDECPTEKWQQNADCQQLLAQLGSTNYRDLQTNFYRQLQEHIAARPVEKQRHLIFWNEVLHGNTSSFAPDATIMAWVGADAAAKEAASRGFATILSPQIPYYINRKQSTLPTEPRSQGYGTETVEAVYNYRPMQQVPETLQSHYLGVQANFWTEWVEDGPTVEYLMLPRLAAVAEAGWTTERFASSTDEAVPVIDWEHFRRRLQYEVPLYDAMGLCYGRHAFETAE